MLGLNKYLIGAGAGLLAIVALLYWRLDSVAADRDKWREDARGKAAVIDTLQNEAARSEAILAALRETQDSIREDSARTRRAIADLERSNEEVRDYLREPIPADLVSVLWPDEDGDDSSDATGSSDGAVRGKRPAPATPR